MAAECPVIVTDTGGFDEIIKHGVNGMKAQAGSTESLYNNIKELISNSELGKSIRNEAYKQLFEKYTWEKVSELTYQIYSCIAEEAFGTKWQSKTGTSDIKNSSEISLTIDSSIHQETVKPKRSRTKKSKIQSVDDEVRKEAAIDMTEVTDEIIPSLKTKRKRKSSVTKL
jgi:hypothetical protein